MASANRLIRLARCGPWSLHRIANTESLPTSTELRISIAKRIVPLAIERNRLRRLARESFRAKLADGGYTHARGRSAWLLRLDRRLDELAAVSLKHLCTSQRKRLYRQSLDALWVLI
ncbi:MAG: ribonuclease P protein component [Burkholderiaceae bacterium]